MSPFFLILRVCKMISSRCKSLFHLILTSFFAMNKSICLKSCFQSIVLIIYYQICFLSGLAFLKMLGGLSDWCAFSMWLSFLHHSSLIWGVTFIFLLLHSLTSRIVCDSKRKSLKNFLTIYKTLKLELVFGD